MLKEIRRKEVKHETTDNIRNLFLLQINLLKIIG